MPNAIGLRAIKLSVLLQSLRTAFDRDHPDAQHGLKHFMSLSSDELDKFVIAAEQKVEFVNVPLREERLFFPDVGLVVIPLIGSQPAIATPIHPSCMIAMVPLGRRAQLDAFRYDNEHQLTALSTGLNQCRGVVIPGSLWGKEQPERMRDFIKNARLRAELLVRAFLDANKQLYGETMPGFKTPTESPFAE